MGWLSKIKGAAPLLLVLLFIGIATFIFDRRQREESEAMQLQLHELQLKYSPAERDTIRDSVIVITQQVMQMDRSEYKLVAADRKLLQDMSLRLSQVAADHRMSMVTADTVKATRRNSVFAYKDEWLSLRLDTADSMLTYKARDSLQCLVTRQYKHKFLWWRWGTKSYDIKVINFNPHSTLLYNSYIQVNQ